MDNWHTELLNEVKELYGERVHGTYVYNGCFHIHRGVNKVTPTEDYSADQAPYYMQSLYMSFYSVYTIYGIKCIDTVLSWLIMDKRVTFKYLFEAIRYNIHLHPKVKNNLLHNLINNRKDWKN